MFFLVLWMWISVYRIDAQYWKRKVWVEEKWKTLSLYTLKNSDDTGPDKLGVWIIPRDLPCQLQKSWCYWWITLLIFRYWHIISMGYYLYNYNLLCGGVISRVHKYKSANIYLYLRPCSKCKENFQLVYSSKIEFRLIPYVMKNHHGGLIVLSS